jgi:hypothetical protein
MVQGPTRTASFRTGRVEEGSTAGSFGRASASVVRVPSPPDPDGSAGVGDAPGFLARKIISQKPTYFRSWIVYPEAVSRWLRLARVK